MGRLDEKVAVITGAASGIGLACASRFASEGARVVGLDIAEPHIELTLPSETWEPIFEDVAAGNVTRDQLADEIAAEVGRRHGIPGPPGPRVFLTSVPFPSPSNSAFTPHTTPSSRSPLGGGSPVHITNIRRLPDGAITFWIGYEYY